MTENAKYGSGWHQHRLKIAIWTTAALILLLPAIAMPFTYEVNWTLGDFVFAGVLLFVPLGIYEVVARKTADPNYRTGAGMALVAALLLLWVNGAVGITDSEADLLYVLALAVGVVGTFVARFRPHGMARAMYATALALAAAGTVALVAGMVPAYNSVFEILGITVLFAVLFVGAALLFRKAARRSPEQDTV